MSNRDVGVRRIGPLIAPVNELLCDSFRTARLEGEMGPRTNLLLDASLSARAQFAFHTGIYEVGRDDAVESRAVLADQGLQPSGLNGTQALFGAHVSRAGGVGCGKQTEDRKDN